MVRPTIRFRPRGRRETKTDCAKFDGPRKRCVAAMLAGDFQTYGEACAELRSLLDPPKPDGRAVPHAGHFKKADHGLDRL